MSILTEETERVVLDGNDYDPGELIHICCECSEDIALCGYDLTGPFWDNPPEEHTCVVCVDLDKQPCPRCGEGSA